MCLWSTCPTCRTGLLDQSILRTLTEKLVGVQFFTVSERHPLETPCRLLVCTVQSLVLFVVRRGDGFVRTVLRQMQWCLPSPSPTVLMT